MSIFAAKRRSKLGDVKSLLGIFLLSAVSTVSHVGRSEAAPLRKAPELAFTIPGEGEKLLSQYRGKVVASGIHSYHLSPLPGGFPRTDQVSGRNWASADCRSIDLAINALDENATSPTEAATDGDGFRTQLSGGFSGWLYRAAAADDVVPGSFIRRAHGGAAVSID